MLKNLVILLFFISQFTCTCFAFTERDFDEMEYIKYGTVYADEDLATRLSRLETDIWGMSQSGNLEDRINNLKRMTITSNNNPSKFEKNNKNKSSIKNFFNNLSEMMSTPVMTGYTPSMDYYQHAYPNNIYRQQYMDFLNNGNNYCAYPNSYSRNHRKTHNNNRYTHNRHPEYHYPQSQYTPYRPTDMFNNFAARSSVHILQD